MYILIHIFICRDQGLFSEEEVVRIKVSYTQMISTLALKSGLRQRVAATAIVYFKRFYVRNSLKEHDPRLIAPVSLYLAAKTEEHTLQAKIVVAQMAALYSADHQYPYSISHVYDYEFKIIAALDFDLIIFHPYRPLMQYAADANMSDLLSTAWPILNDSFRSDICLLFPPYIVAIACLFMAGTLHDRPMQEWIASLKIESQDVVDAVQHLNAMYSTGSPAAVRGADKQLALINNLLQTHFGPRIKIPGPVSKKPPSSRPKSSRN